MPYSYPNNVPRPARKWTPEEQRKCVAAANAVLRDGGSDQDAIFACIRAAGRSTREMKDHKMTKKVFDSLSGEEKIAFYYEHIDCDEGQCNEARWTRSFINDLPDISFAYIEPGGKKDKQGKTVPRNLRHFPHHGQIKTHTWTNADPPHVRNAAARIGQGARFGQKAKPHIDRHKRAMGIGEAHDGRVFLEEVLETEIIMEDAKPDAKYRTGRLQIAQGNIINRNRRVYRTELLAREVGRAQEKVREGRLIGLDGHPNLFNHGKLSDAVIKFEDLWMEGDNPWGRVIFLPTSKGKDIIALAEAGVRIPASMRGRGSVKKDKWEGQEAYIVQDDYELLGIDLVLDAGFEQAAVYQFEMNQQEEPMPVTLEQLREEYPELVEQIERDAVGTAVPEVVRPYEELVAAMAVEFELDEEGDLLEQLKAMVAEMRQSHEQAQAAWEDERVTLAASVEALTEERDAARNRVQALTHLRESVQGKPFAWLLLTKSNLWEAATPEDVDRLLPTEETFARQIMEGIRDPAGRGYYVPPESDLDETEDKELPPEQDPQKRVYLRASGLAE